MVAIGIRICNPWGKGCCCLVTESCPVLCDGKDCSSHQAPLPMGFSRQEYWSGLPCPPPGDLPDPVIKPMSPVTPALAGGFFTTEPPGKPHLYVTGWDKSPSWLSLLNFLIFTEV